MIAPTIRNYFFVILLIACFFNGYAQPTWTFDPFGKEKKPAEYEEKLLPSERTGDKKFTRLRRFTQNNVTHYNYFFNANNKISLVLDLARSQQQDDYSKLLPFYSFSLDQTAAQQVELDSVIYKSTAGILLHDLRTDWVDNLYLLIGKSYYYRKVIDSAILTFQFINYNLFPREKGEDDNRIVGTNQENDTKKLSIADPEKRNILKRIFSLPPSRNDALLWLSRSYLEDNQYGESAGLLNILQEDPNLPKRLIPELNQIISYWYYKQEAYDSAAVYLEKALPSALNSADRARWRYLLAQLYEMTGRYDKASEYYISSARKTVNPLIEIYASLNNAKMLRNSGNIRELDNNIARLVKMAKKDKYEAYKDIIYHSAGMLTMKKNDTAAACLFFEKSLSVNTENLKFRNQAHLELGRIAYRQREYKKAADHYDSLDITEASLLPDSTEVSDRKSSLRKIADQLAIIQLEDSLQMIAAMSTEDQERFVRKLIRKMRKEKGESDVDNDPVLLNPTGGMLNSFGANSNAEPADLFGSSGKGEWYFYNNSSKSRGFNEFKSRWGKRENVDNWRRQSAIALAQMQVAADPMSPTDPTSQTTTDSSQLFNYENMMANLPTNQEKLDSSNHRLATALFELARLFQNELADYLQAIFTYELYLQRFPDKLEDGQVYLGLYYCYNKLGDRQKTLYYQSLLEKEFPNSVAWKTIKDPLSLQPEKNNPTISAEYQSVYQLFAQEKYEEAMELKRNADGKYGDQYWTPQLMYIEAIYFIKCASDSEAIVSLDALLNRYPESPLSQKAKSLVDVLKRRNEIESYLSGLTITKLPEDERIVITDNKRAAKKSMGDQPAKLPNSILTDANKRIKTDSSFNKVPEVSEQGYSWQSGKEHLVVMVLNQVDQVYVSEAQRAIKSFNQSNAFTSLQIKKDTFDTKRNLLVLSKFENAEDALTYFGKLKKNSSAMFSWLPANKYIFIIIHTDNYTLLQKQKDIEQYQLFLKAQYPDRF
jgi:tetratricopeptide (TPR) repeat protein